MPTLVRILSHPSPLICSQIRFPHTPHMELGRKSEHLFFQNLNKTNRKELKVYRICTHKRFGAFEFRAVEKKL
jgi:hypothetical protein